MTKSTKIILFGSVGAILAVATCLVVFPALFPIQESPDQSDEARKGYELYSPLIDSIEVNAKNNNGVYPQNIDSIVLRFSGAAQKEMNEYGLLYTTADSLRSFTLTFSWVTGPINACTWSSKTDSWTCESYY